MAVELTLDLDLLRQAGSTIDVVDGSVSGGTAEPGGVGNTAPYPFGGLVQVHFERFWIASREEHLYWNLLAARLNGSIRDIIVPLPTARIWPAGVSATLAGAQSAKASEITIAVAAGSLGGGEWFGIDHTDVGPRAHRISAIVGTSDAGGGVTHYDVVIDPPLRGSASDGAPLSFTPPTCLMRLPDGETMPWLVSPSRLPRPSVTFIEQGW